MHKTIKLITLTILIFSIWVFGFYIGNKVEKDKKINYLVSVSYSSILTRALELNKDDKNQELINHLTNFLNSSLFSMIHDYSNGQLDAAEKAQVMKMISRIDKVLKRLNMDYLIPESQINENNRAYHRMMKKNIQAIREEAAKSVEPRQSQVEDFAKPPA